MNARDTILASFLFNSGEVFYLSTLSERLGLDAELAKQALDELIAEGRADTVPAATRLGVTKYHRVSQATLLIRKRWDRQLDLRAVAG